MKGQLMDYYRVLEITENASEEEIKREYRRLSKRLHPDMNPGNEEAERRFKEISEAYAVLSDKAKRKAYDLERQKIDRSCGKTRKAANRGKAGASTFGFEDISSNFEQFFGFHPEKGNGNDKKRNTDKEKKTNPLDMTDLFETYMGFQSRGEKKK